MVLGRSLWAQVCKLAIPEIFLKFALMITGVHAVYLVPIRTTGAGCSLKVLSGTTSRFDTNVRGVGATATVRRSDRRLCEL